MTEEKRDMDIEGLFRNKLEENEMEAGADLTGRVMRRLERKEFLRFNPSRFNIFYAAAALAVITVAGLLFFPSPGAEESPLPAVREPQQTEQATTDEKKVDGANEQEVTVIPSLKETDTSGDQPVTQPAAITPRQNETLKPVVAGSESSATREVRKGEPATVRSLRRAVIETSASSGCVPLTVRFSYPSAGSMKADWSFGDGGKSDENAPDYIYDLPGTYIVSLTLTDAEGNKSSAATRIDVWPGPKAEFEITKNKLAETGEVLLFSNLSTGGVKYLWNFGDGTTSDESDPQHIYKSYGRYDVRLTVYSEQGCADSVTITDIFTDKGMFLRFPTAFLPNTGGPTGGYYSRRTDEANQVFHPVASGVASYNLKIYNKVGLLVFESSDIEMGWDGYYKGQLCPPGVYVWKVRGTYRNGQAIVMAGDVTLISY
jgi:PKD repeat protein